MNWTVTDILLIIFGIKIYTISTNVVLSPEYSSAYITITCKAEDKEASLYTIHLSCPFVNPGFCFSNCTAHCVFNPLGECVRHSAVNAISRCQYHHLNESNAISTSYQINTSQIHTAGDWSCSFKNFKSNSISLAKYEPPATTTRAYQETNPVVITQVEKERKDSSFKILTDTTVTEDSNSDKEKPQTTKTKGSTDNTLLDQMTRPELVLILIILLGISLLLNLSFLIRCVLLKSVIENYYRGIPNSQCILECLCLDLVLNKYAHKRYSRSLTASNQVTGDFYRCQAMCPDNMAIYDDLSAVSNNSARMKMRSNHSSEMDEESRMTSLMQNGGCHGNTMGAGSLSESLNRRYPHASHAYYHPGLGNYVIVSGPVAAHDQYSMATGPPGYALQIVSPIPSAPGSIVAGPGTQNSASSAHSDDSDNDSRTASIPTSVPYRTSRINSQQLDLRDSTKLIDMSHNILVPINGFDQSQLYHNDSLKNVYVSNGSVPLQQKPKENVIPTSSSISSLPFCTHSENGACSEKILNHPKEFAIRES